MQSKRENGSEMSDRAVPKWDEEIAQITELRRQRILQTARQLFFDRGYVAVSMDELGTASGISGPALYRYFRSKQDILASVLSQAADDMLGEQRPPADGTPAERLEALVDLLVRRIIQNREIALIHARDEANLRPEDRDRLAAVQTRLRTVWTNALAAARRDLAPDDLPVMIEAAIWMVRSSAYAATPDDDDDRVIRVLRTMVLDALLGPHRSDRDP